MTVLWVYAILGSVPREPPGVGLGGEAVRVLSIGQVLVSAGTLPTLPAEDAAALARHEAVIRGLARTVDAILPLRFGAATADEAALSALLASRSAELLDALALVAGREQMTLRVYGDPQPPADATPQAPPSPPGGGSTLRHGGRYMTARLVARANAHAVPEIEPMRGSLATFVRAERVEHHVLPPLLASVFHLVERGQAAPYAAAVEAAAAGLGSVRVAATGPQPPYAFAPEALGLHASGQ